MGESAKLGHGTRLTTREYEKRIVALHQSASGDEAVRRGELELLIDHKLGCEFPRERREAMWRIQQEVERRRVRVAAEWVLLRIVPGWLTRKMDRLGGYMRRRYSEVLNGEELDAFFGPEG